MMKERRKRRRWKTKNEIKLILRYVTVFEYACEINMHLRNQYIILFKMSMKKVVALAAVHVGLALAKHHQYEDPFL